MANATTSPQQGLLQISSTGSLAEDPVERVFINSAKKITKNQYLSTAIPSPLQSFAHGFPDEQRIILKADD